MPTPEQNVSTDATPAKLPYRANNLAGRWFGRLFVLSVVGKTAARKITWLCRCTCGQTKIVVGSALLSGNTSACGNCKKDGSIIVRNLCGKRFGKLLVLSQADGRSSGHVRWSCLCDCGKTIITTGHSLRGGQATLCRDCLIAKAAEARVTHGQSRTKAHNCTGAYTSWYNMLQRTTNPSNKQWEDYGGRGITVSEEYRDFSRFFADLGPRPFNMTLERIDNEKGYEPGNLCYADRQKQARNKRARKDSETGWKGIIIRGDQYRVLLGVDGKNKHIGYYPLTLAGLEAAKAARLLAEDVYWGDNK